MTLEIPEEVRLARRDPRIEPGATQNSEVRENRRNGPRIPSLARPSGSSDLPGNSQRH